MGDFFERIVDVEVTAAEAGAAAERMVDWMVSEGILLREISDVGVYSEGVGEGFLPGPQWRRVVADDWDPGPVAVIVGRGDYCEGQGDDVPESATCPRCQTKTVTIDYPEKWEADPEVWEPFQDAINAWKETGTGAAACPSCGESTPVTQWQWPAGFALGALAFDFWGWPPLTDAFVEEFATQSGHRTKYQMGKF